MINWYWLIAIHVGEVIAVAIYLLVRKNLLLEKSVSYQQQYLDAVSISIENARIKLNELDKLGAFKADDEVGFFFQNLQEIQELLDTFIVSKK